MRNALLLCVVTALAAACSSGSSTPGRPAATPGPKTLDQSIWDSYCRDASVVVDTLQGIQKGTVTRSEAVSVFAKQEAAIHNDSLAASDGFPKVSAKFQAVADAIGRMKVAIDGGDQADPTALNTAASALPNCSAKPPSDS